MLAALLPWYLGIPLSLLLTLIAVIVWLTTQGPGTTVRTLGSLLVISLIIALIYSLIETLFARTVLADDCGFDESGNTWEGWWNAEDCDHLTPAIKGLGPATTSTISVGTPPVFGKPPQVPAGPVIGQPPIEGIPGITKPGDIPPVTAGTVLAQPPGDLPPSDDGKPTDSPPGDLPPADGKTHPAEPGMSPTPQPSPSLEPGKSETPEPSPSLEPGQSPSPQPQPSASAEPGPSASPEPGPSPSPSSAGSSPEPGKSPSPDSSVSSSPEPGKSSSPGSSVSSSTESPASSSATAEEASSSSSPGVCELTGLELTTSRLGKGDTPGTDSYLLSVRAFYINRTDGNAMLNCTASTSQGSYGTVAENWKNSTAMDLQRADLHPGETVAVTCWLDCGGAKLSASWTAPGGESSSSSAVPCQVTDVELIANLLGKGDIPGTQSYMLSVRASYINKTEGNAMFNCTVSTSDRSYGTVAENWKNSLVLPLHRADLRPGQTVTVTCWLDCGGGARSVTAWTVPGGPEPSPSASSESSWVSSASSLLSSSEQSSAESSRSSSSSLFSSSSSLGSSSSSSELTSSSASSTSSSSQSSPVPSSSSSASSDGSSSLSSSDSSSSSSSSESSSSSSRSIKDWTAAEKLAEAIRRALPWVPGEAKEKLLSLLDPFTLALMAGIWVTWMGSHLVGVGFVVDILILVGGVALMGLSLIKAAHDLYKFLRIALNAESEVDLTVAGQHLASAVTTIGVDIVIAFLTYKFTKAWQNRYRPTGRGDPSLPPGSGGTNKFGDYRYSTSGTAEQQALAKFHEQMHSFLSPKLQVLRNFRADLRSKGYKQSALLKYLEEALCETYAQLRVNGLKGLPEGIMFPINNGYVTLQAVAGEATAVGTVVGTVTAGGAVYQVYVQTSE